MFCGYTLLSGAMLSPVSGSVNAFMSARPCEKMSDMNSKDPDQSAMTDNLPAGHEHNSVTGR